MQQRALPPKSLATMPPGGIGIGGITDRDSLRKHSAPIANILREPGGGLFPPPPPSERPAFKGPASITAIEDVIGEERPDIAAASALGRPEGEGIEAYMDAAGVGAQVDQAQEDYERELNRLQAQQAGSGAFGSRAQLQDLGAMESHLRNVGQLRAAGYDKAAARMEADLAREQQAAVESERIGADLTGTKLRAGTALGAEERAIGETMLGMGEDQRRIMEDQRRFDETQWRKTLEGPGKELSMLWNFLPPEERREMERQPGGFEKWMGRIGSGIGLLSKIPGL